MKIDTRQLTLIALFLALSVIVPIVFHMIGAGSVFLPMFLPILLAGFLIEFPLAILVGLLAPWLSAFVTGMPPLFPTALIMSIEGASATAVIGYFFYRRNWKFMVCLVLGIIVERISLVLMGFVLAPLFNLPGEIFSIYKLTQSLPGVGLQIILIPIIYKIVERSQLINTLSK
ncbi:MAG TPA: ECF transporter S component [bacterium]|nr:ECF transporter S component [bacterium]